MASIHAYQKMNSSSLVFGRINWLGTLALLGTLLLFIGVSLSNAGVVEEKVLPKIMKQLKDQGKNVRSTSVMDVSGESEITITLMTGEVRQYNEKGQLTKAVDPYGKVTLYEDGMPTEELDPNGTVISRTKYYKSATGKLQKMVKRSAAGVVTKLFDSDGNAVQATDSQGSKIFSNYIKNEDGKTVSYVETDLATNKTVTNILDPKNGEVVAKIDGNNIRTDIENQYNEDGEKVGVVERDSAGKVVTKKYENGQMVEETRNGIKTTFENVVNTKGVLTEKKEIKMMPTADGMIEDITTKKYDDQGRVIEMENAGGRHTYTYETNAEGRIIARNEKTEPKDGTQPTEKLTIYDETGKVVGTKSDNSETKITNVVDEKGNLVFSSEIITYKFGGQVYSTVVTKKYDDNGNVLIESDQYGNQTQNTYDAKGNRIRTKNEDSVTNYTYDDANRLVSGVSQDRKSRTLTNYNEDTKLAERKVMIKNSGVVEITTYGITSNGKRASYTQGPFGIKVSVNRDATSDQPEKTTYTKYNGKVIVTKYQYAGEHMITSKEEGPSGVTETKYNGSGQPIETFLTDQWGRTKFTVNEYAKGKIAQSLLTDDKGKTVTTFNKDGDPKKIVRENEIGYPRKTEEERTYKDGMLSVSVSYDVKGKTITYYDENELPVKVHRINYHGFPREHWTYNFYDAGGDVESSVQLDERGQTRNSFDADGLTQESVRVDIHGFPKKKTTSYTYDDGEMVSSITDTDRYTDHNKFDKDGLMRETTKEKKFGFPKTEHTTYEYDNNAYMTFSRSEDANGTTENFYNIDELVAISHRVNTYGHARDQWTVNLYNGSGYLTSSKETDLKGVTMTEFNIDGLATQNVRYDQYGVEYSRNTLTVNDYDGNGFMTTSMSKNLLTTMKKEFDKDSLVQYSEQNDNYGLLDGRYKVSNNYAYDEFGRIQSNTTEDDLGKTESAYDIHGDAIETIRHGKVGLYASRETVTQSQFDADTGITTYRVSKSAYGTTESSGFDPKTGLESVNTSMNNFGLKGALYTVTEVDMDVRHGLQRYSKATNELGVTETFFDTQSDGPYGIAVRSKSENIYGLKGALETATEITASKHNGITQETLAKNGLGITKTKYQDGIGNAIQSETENFYGLKGARSTKTEITSSEYHGITEYTDAKTELGRTQTWYGEGVGNAHKSVSDNTYGLKGSLHTETTIQSSEFHGITEHTEAVNELGTTQTWYGEGVGNAVKSVSDNNYGLGGSKHTETTIQSSDFHGITEYTQAINELGTTQTWYTEGVGNATRSITDNVYGLGGAKHTETTIQSSDFHGITEYTDAVNELGRTQTWYAEGVGNSVKSVSDNIFGLKGALHTETTIQSSEFHGITEQTDAVNELGRTQTWYQEGVGNSVKSISDNVFGLKASKHTETTIQSSEFHGISEYTDAVNEMGRTQTWYAEGVGNAVKSVSDNVFGLEGAKHTETTIQSSEFHGITEYTDAANELGRTQTWYVEGIGNAMKSVSDNTYGLGGSKHTETTIQSSDFHGITEYTDATNELGRTQTWYQENVGNATKSVSDNIYGLKGALHTETTIQSSDYHGITEYTDATNELGRTQTWYQENVGNATKSVSDNIYGLKGALHTETTIQSSEFHGITEYTDAVNELGRTQTWYGEGVGNATKSVSDNVFGLKGSLHTETTIQSSEFHGVNEYTVGINELGQTQTWYQDGVGNATRSVSDNVFGLGGSKHTETTIQSSDFHGITEYTDAVNELGRTQTWYQEGIGNSTKSVSDNVYGLKGALHTETTIQSSDFHGITEYTDATNELGRTQTWYQEGIGNSTKSVSDNIYGLKGSLHTETEIQSSEFHGISEYTDAVNDLGRTQTWYQDGVGNATKSVSDNNYGLTGSKHTETTIQSSEFHGVNEYTDAVNELGRTQTWYQDGVGNATKSVSDNVFGLEGAKHTETTIQSSEFHGVTEYTDAVNELGRTQTWYVDGVGNAARSVSDNVFGLGGSKHTETTIQSSDFHGITEYTDAVNELGRTQTWYVDGVGNATKSVSDNIYGLTGSLHTETTIQSSDFHGITEYTDATNQLGRTQTWYQDGVGNATKSVSDNNYGLTGSKHTETEITSSQFHGITEYTDAVNDLGRTQTWYVEGVGNAARSVSDNVYGLGGAKHTETEITSSQFHGITEYTDAVNELGRTQTWYVDGIGNAMNSVSDNIYGLGGAKHTETAIQSSQFHGITEYTD
ncbi:hypothetical protein K8S19_01890, partial [bacterium]|nr:hypothetical protein [bacterium]